jgi:hypothetical protein
MSCASSRGCTMTRFLKLKSTRASLAVVGTALFAASFAVVAQPTFASALSNGAETALPRSADSKDMTGAVIVAQATDTFRPKPDRPEKPDRPPRPDRGIGPIDNPRSGAIGPIENPRSGAIGPMNNPRSGQRNDGRGRATPMPQGGVAPIERPRPGGFVAPPDSPRGIVVPIEQPR